jgi:hypothetical protein
MKVLISQCRANNESSILIDDIVDILMKNNVPFEKILVPVSVTKNQELNHNQLLIQKSFFPNVNFHISCECKYSNSFTDTSSSFLTPCKLEFENKDYSWTKSYIINLTNLKNLEKYLIQGIENEQNKIKINFNVNRLAQNSFIIARLMLIRSRLFRNLLLLIWSNLKSLQTDKDMKGKFLGNKETENSE